MCRIFVLSKKRLDGIWEARFSGTSLLLSGLNTSLLSNTTAFLIGIVNKRFNFNSNIQGPARTCLAHEIRLVYDRWRLEWTIKQRTRALKATFLPFLGWKTQKASSISVQFGRRLIFAFAIEQIR